MEALTTLFWIGFWLSLALVVFNFGLSLLGMLIAGVVAIFTALVEWVREG